MNCRQVERRLAALLDGTMAPNELTLCRAHAERCPACAELLAMARCASEPESPNLVAEVLAQTIGSACPSARQLLCPSVDHELEAAERELLDVHLAGCEQCRATRDQLAAFSVELPRLAEIDVDAAFTAEVLAATLPVTTRLRRWWGRRWRRWVHRPCFASEVAYAAVLAVLLLFQVTGTQLTALTRPADLVIVEAGAGAVIEELFSGAVDLLKPVFEYGETKCTLVVEQVGAVADTARRRCAELRRAASSNVGTFSSWAASLLANDRESEPAGEDREPVKEAP